MAFKRKEKDYPTRVKAYKFRVFPPYQKEDFDAEIKDALFAQARAMNAFWNRLIEIRRRTLEELDAAFEEFKPDGGEEGLNFTKLKKLSPEFAARTKEIWEKFETEIRAEASSEETKSVLGWEAREDVTGRFDTAHKKALKAGAELRLKSEGFITQFHIPHRFTGGGKEPASFSSGRSKKFYLEDLPEEFYSDNSYRNRKARIANGKIGAGAEDETTVSFRAVLHRRIPEGARVKTAVLTGRFKNRKWEYYLVLTVDEPAPPLLAKSGNKPVAGIDFGWRKFEDYLRVGMVVDAFGNAYELRLPINPPKKQSLRRLERLLKKHGKEVRNFPQNWQDIEDWQAKISGAKDRIKELLKELELPKHEEISSLLAHWERVGKRGLLKLLRILRDGDEPPAGDAAKAVALLEEWRDRTTQLEAEANYARQRLINQRKKYYALIANWLKAHYGQLAIEGDLSLKELASQGAKAKLTEKNGAVIKNAAKYRVIASLYELKTALQQREQKGENWLVKVKSAYSTRRCYICGSECEKTAALEIVCLKGHRVDQDIQAAINLRNNLADDFPTRRPPFSIPEELKNLIVPAAEKL